MHRLTIPAGPIAFRAIAFGIAALMIPLVSSAQVVNGGFETPVLAPNTFQTITTGTEPAGFAWQVGSGNIDVAHLPLTSLGINFNAFEGNQAADLNGTTSGSMQQDFPTTPGQTYQINFAYADNPLGGGVASAAISVTDTLVGIHLTDAVTHSTTTSNNADWFQYSNTFTATTATSRVLFVSTSADTGASGGIFLDAVTVSLVPEPTSAALLSLAGIGLLSRRLRRA